MRNKKWLFIILGIILFIFLVFFILGIFKRPKKDDSLLISKNHMLKELKTFSYDSKVNINVYGLNLDVDVNCKEDRVNKLGYCSATSNVINIEEYMDYKNKVTYSKSDLISNYRDNSSWSKNEEKNIEEAPMLKIVDKIKIQKKEKKDNGILYTGIIDGKSLGQVIRTASKTTNKRIGIGRIFKKKVPVEVFVNSNNNIEYLKSNISVLGIKINLDIKYSNYNTSSSLSLPGEVYELQN